MLIVSFTQLKKRSAYYGEKGTEALKDMVVGFFEKEVEELETCIPRKTNLDKSYKAKSEFYLSCNKNNNIRGIGFNRSNSFPIRKSRFKNHVSKDRVRALNSDYIIYDTIVTSPVIEDKDYVWDLEDCVTGNKISAKMRDFSFKSGVLSGKYPFKNDGSNSDRLQVLIEYKKQEKNGEVEKKGTFIESVYRFNEEEVAEVPDDLPKGTKFQMATKAPMEDFWS